MGYLLNRLGYHLPQFWARGETHHLNSIALQNCASFILRYNFIGLAPFIFWLVLFTNEVVSEGERREGGWEMESWEESRALFKKVYSSSFVCFLFTKSDPASAQQALTSHYWKSSEQGVKICVDTVKFTWDEEVKQVYRETVIPRSISGYLGLV